MLVEGWHTGDCRWRAHKSDDSAALLGERMRGATKPPALRVCSVQCVDCSSISTVRKFARTTPSALPASPKLPQRLPKKILSEAQVERLT